MVEQEAVNFEVAGSNPASRAKTIYLTLYPVAIRVTGFCYNLAMDFSVYNIVKRFPGKYGWYYIELAEDVSKDLRPILKGVWPALLKAEFTLNQTTWESSIMPIKDGPLFIALPSKIRKAEDIDVDQIIKVDVELLV